MTVTLHAPPRHTACRPNTAAPYVNLTGHDLGDDIDLVAVERTVNGHPPQHALSGAEQQACARILIDRGQTANHTATVLGVGINTVRRWTRPPAPTPPQEAL